MENSHLMSQSQRLQFQRGPTPKPEGDRRNHCGQARKHAGHDKAVGAKLQCLQNRRYCEQPTLLDRPGNADIQMDLFYDYRTNLPLYPAVHA
jgi:hypothetical protein